MFHVNRATCPNTSESDILTKLSTLGNFVQSFVVKKFTKISLCCPDPLYYRSYHFFLSGQKLSFSRNPDTSGAAIERPTKLKEHYEIPQQTSPKILISYHYF